MVLVVHSLTMLNGLFLSSRGQVENLSLFLCCDLVVELV